MGGGHKAQMSSLIFFHKYLAAKIIIPIFAHG